MTYLEILIPYFVPACYSFKEETKRVLVEDIQTVINWFYENYIRTI